MFRLYFATFPVFSMTFTQMILYFIQIMLNKSNPMAQIVISFQCIYPKMFTGYYLNRNSHMHFKESFNFKMIKEVIVESWNHIFFFFLIISIFYKKIIHVLIRIKKN